MIRTSRCGNTAATHGRSGRLSLGFVWLRKPPHTHGTPAQGQRADVEASDRATMRPTHRPRRAVRGGLERGDAHAPPLAARAYLLAACLPTLAIAATSATRTPPPIIEPVRLIEPAMPDVLRFAEAVAADGDIVAIAAPTDGDDALEPGEVAVHRLAWDAGGGLVVDREDVLRSVSTAPGDHFGVAVAVALDDRDHSRRGLIAVGADRAEWPASGLGTMCGAVDLFERETRPDGSGGSAWPHIARLVPHAPQPGSEFGASLALGFVGRTQDSPRAHPPASGSVARLVVGAPRTDIADSFDAGHVHVFERRTAVAGDAPNGSWREIATIEPPVPQMSSWFGSSVAIEGEYLAVGSPGQDNDGADPADSVRAAGAVYLYRVHAPQALGARARVELLRVLVSPEPAHAAWFGYAVALRDGVLAVGSPRARDEIEGSAAVGCVYLYDLAHSGVGPKRVNPPGPSASLPPSSGFGQTVAMRNGMLLIGAPSADVARSTSHGNGDAPNDSSIEDVGTAWLYALVRGEYVGELRAPRMRPSAHFGASVALAIPRGALEARLDPEFTAEQPARRSAQVLDPSSADASDDDPLDKTSPIAHLTTLPHAVRATGRAADRSASHAAGHTIGACAADQMALEGGQSPWQQLNAPASADRAQPSDQRPIIAARSTRLWPPMRRAPIAPGILNGGFIAIAGHRYVEEESIAPSAGAALYPVPAGQPQDPAPP